MEGPDPEFLFKHRYEAPVGRSLTALYRVAWDGFIRHQESEVEWGDFVPLKHVPEMIEEHEFCPDSLELFRRFLKWRQGLP